MEGSVGFSSFMFLGYEFIGAILIISVVELESPNLKDGQPWKIIEYVDTFYCFLFLLFGNRIHRTRRLRKRSIPETQFKSEVCHSFSFILSNGNF